MKTAVYNSTGDVDITVKFDGVAAGANGTLTLLTAPDGFSYNSIGSDVVQTNVTTVTAGNDGSFYLCLPNLSISVFETAVEGTASQKRSTKMLPRVYREINF